MKKNLIILPIILFFQCGNSQKQNNTKMKHKFSNHLIKENSPYLLQHAHNPVDWYPWGEIALKKAKNEDKLLLISIGYSACHWCHVMEHESFENESIAKIMNENFVCIKVDREEHPDVDQIYMIAVQLITGNGGWPLNCFALPDGRPVYGGTYFKPNQWKDILENLALGYENDKQRYINSAEQLQQGIINSEFVKLKSEPTEFSIEELTDAVENWKSSFDKINGGEQKAPKFPMPSTIDFLMKYYYYTNDDEVLRHINLTLEKMAKGGIYDQLGGGFSRYSVDEHWKVPHFEKMLYDNAQLVSLYSNAYLLTKNDLYKKIVYQTLEFIKRELTSPENGFYSSLDADSEGEEGKYYVWKKEEIDEILGNSSDLFCDYYAVKESGNWEQGVNILHIIESSEKIAKKYNLTETGLLKTITSLNNKLRNAREERIHPGLDDKVLTSWNALMIKAYVDAYLVFKEDKFLIQATKAAEFLEKNILQNDFSLLRNYKDGKSKINAFLDDYSFTIEAFIALFQATYNENYLRVAKKLTDYTLEHFYDYETAMFFYASDVDFNLIVRKKEISDNVIPSSNSSMAKNLFTLGVYYSDSSMNNKSKQMLTNINKKISSNITYFSNWASVMLWFTNSPYELVVTGPDTDKLSIEILNDYRPDIIFAGSVKDKGIPVFENRYVKNQSIIYVCKHNVCKQPVSSVNEAKKILQQ